jgi:hypothetical protein
VGVLLTSFPQSLCYVHTRLQERSQNQSVHARVMDTESPGGQGTAPPEIQNPPAPQSLGNSSSGNEAPPGLKPRVQSPWVLLFNSGPQVGGLMSP